MKGPSNKGPCKARYLFTNNVLIFIFLMLPTGCIVPQVRFTNASMHVRSSPCCSFPCKNGGSCMETCQGYKCDCTGTNHYGRNCQTEHTSHKLRKFIWAAAMKLGLTNFVTDMRLVQYEPKFSKDHGGFCNQNFNVCREPMLLSPVPENCPTPLGTYGFQILPNIESLFDLVLKRRCSTEQTTSSTNLLFLVFAQFLANQMWKCTNPNWIGSPAMYGSFVRTGLSGKVSKQQIEHQGDIYQNVFTDVFQSIILHEHNRLCDLISIEHPRWNDHRIFETATLIVTGEILTIASAEWLPLLHDFEGTLNMKSSYPYAVSNKVPKETKLAFLWPQMFPNVISIDGSCIDLGILLNGNRALPHGGHYQLMKFVAATAPGKMGPQNVPTGMEEATKMLIMEGRNWKFQSFNNYREYLGLGRLKSFAQLTDNNVVKRYLEKMYGDIDGLELIPGLLLETPKKGELLGETTTALVSNAIFKAIVTHPLNTLPFKKKFTFGGISGWNIVKNAQIHSLICNNVYDKRLCEKEGMISFKKKTHPFPVPPASKVNAEYLKKSSCCKNTAKIAEPKKKCLPLTPVTLACNKDGTKQTLGGGNPCSEKVQNTAKSQKTSCAPPTTSPKKVAHCNMKIPEVKKTEPKTCENKVEVKATTCPQKVKKCCIKRPWFRTRPKKVAQCAKPEMQKPPCTQKTACPQQPSCAPKTVVDPKMEPKLESQCKTPTAEKALQGKKCCVKRSWFRAWKG